MVNKDVYMYILFTIAFSISITLLTGYISIM